MEKLQDSNVKNKLALHMKICENIIKLIHNERLIIYLIKILFNM